MDRRVHSTIRFIQAEYHRELALTEMANHVNLSASRLRHLFKLETGISPMQYLKKFRMVMAKYFVETSFLSIKQVMAKVGLSDQSHFVRDFEKTYGLTPARHRVHVHRESEWAFHHHS